MHNKQNRIIALAAIFQATALVKQIAQTGTADTQKTQTCMQSLLKLDAASVKSIYGDISNLQLGLTELINLFAYNKQLKDQEIARYVLSLIYLERRLIKNQDMLHAIQQGILRAQTQIQHFPITHENVIANFASIYTDTISTFNFRVNIIGEPQNLTDTSKANKMRALLLAGIRGAVLWRQMGGGRLQLIFARKKLVKDAQILLEQAHSLDPTKI